jgi:hypothetical protein
MVAASQFVFHMELHAALFSCPVPAAFFGVEVVLTRFARNELPPF